MNALMETIELRVKQMSLRKMLVRVTFILATFLCLGSASFNSARAQNEFSAEQVDRAIRKSVDYLIQNQNGSGGWKEIGGYDMGASCLVTLALLNAGQDYQSPQMKRALNYITSKELSKTYTVSLQTMALCVADPELYASAIRKNVEWLISKQLDDGGWSYGSDYGGSDPSNSQFALLALHEAQRVSVDVPKQRLKGAFDKARFYWVKLQNDDGSFRYGSNDVATGSMTCAGIASLIIVGSQSDQLAASARESVQCCGGDDDIRRRIEKAMGWMGKNFNVLTNPGNGRFYYYYMYGLERAGRLSGRRFFVDARGNRDWYREGIRPILSFQAENGGFREFDGGGTLGNSFTESALALLFLAKGKRQVVVNRLDYGQDADWNHHPMSVQHLTAHTEQAWKRDLAWQTVRIKQAKVEDLLEAPVLFISGSNAPNFSRDEKLLLKRYVEQGGFIFAEACNGDGCKGAAFEEYFKKLVVELFEAPLEKLAPDHPIWTAETSIDPKDLPEGTWLYGVQTCCRLGVVYSPYSLSCRWELNLPYGNLPDYSPAVLGDLKTATKVGVNVLSYATGKELKEKLDTVSILEEVVQKTSTERGLFMLPILQHNAGADEAPRAVKTLIEWLNQENPFQMSSEKKLVPIEKESLETFTVVFMHGRGKLQLSESQREALRGHFKNGGSLICDSICADEQFTESFRGEMEIILGRPLKTMEVSKHPLFTKKFGGFEIQELSVIDKAEGGGGPVSANIQRRAPMIEAGYQDDRICVLFSPLDISCALESKHSLQCKGYVREDAARLGINMLLFSLQQ